MKIFLSRRFIAVAAAVLLAGIMLPLATASPDAAPPATTGDSAQVVPEPDSSAPVVSAPDSSAPVVSAPDSSAPAVSAPDSSAPSGSDNPADAGGSIDPDQTTGPAADVPPANDLLALTTTPVAAMFSAPRSDLPTPVLTVQFDDDTPLANSSITQNGMQTAVQAAVDAYNSEKGTHWDWHKFKSIRLVGTATSITGDNWDYLRAMMFYKNYSGQSFADTGFGTHYSPTVLDLRDMSQLILISDLSKFYSTFGDNTVSNAANINNPTKGLGYDAHFSENVLMPSQDTNGNWNYRTVYFPTTQGLQIGNYAFTACASLRLTELPANLITIGAQAFMLCHNVGLTELPNGMQKVYIGAFDANSTSPIGNVVLGKHSAGDPAGKLTLPASLKVIDAWAFRNQSMSVLDCRGMQLDVWGYASFQSCQYLTEITLPDSAAHDESALHPNPDPNQVGPGGNIFQSCSNIGDLTIKSSLQVGYAMFYKSGINSLTINGPGAAYIGGIAFRNCSSLTSVTVNNADGSYFETNAFADCPDLQTVKISGNNMTFKPGAFYNGFTSTTADNASVTITGDSITLEDCGSGNGVFEGCNKLASVTITGANPYVGKGAFKNSFVQSPDNADDVFVNIHCTAPSTNAPLTHSHPEIGANAFEGCMKLRNVTISGDHVQMGDNAFLNSFQSSAPLPNQDVAVNLSGNGATVGDYVFKGCNKLKTVIITTNGSSVGNNMFDSCVELNAVTLDCPDTTFGNYTFTGCENLSTVKMTCPNTDSQHKLAKFGDNTFYNCINLETVNIPDATGATFGNQTFYKCDKLNTVTMTKAADATFGDQTFYQCKKLANITVNATGATFGDETFAECPALTTINLTASGATFRNKTFYHCNGLTTLNIPNADGATFGNQTFFQCSGLKSVTLNAPKGVFGDETFAECPALTTINLTAPGAKFNDLTFHKCDGLINLDIPNADSVTFRDKTFYECSNLNSVTLNAPNTVFGSQTFAACPKLAAIKLTGDGMTFANKTFDSCAGLINLNLESVGVHFGDYTFNTCPNLETVTLAGKTDDPTKGMYFGSNTFEQCAKLKSVTITGDYMKLENNTFNQCSGLSEATISGQGTQFGNSTFNECDHLKHISLTGNDIQFNGTRTFNGCNALQTVDCEGSGLHFGEESFFKCTGLTTVNVTGDGTLFGTRAFSGCSNLTNLNITGNKTSLGKQILYGCPKVTNLSIGGNDTNLAASAFENNDSIETVKFYLTDEDTGAITGGDNPVLGEHAFQNCLNLTYVEFKDNSSPQIGNYAFDNCPKLTAPTVTGHSTSIGDGAFQGCETIENVDLTYPGGDATTSDGVKIGKDAYNGCTNLKDLKLPPNPQIGESAFAGCKKLQKIEIEGDNAVIGSGAFAGCTDTTSVSIDVDLLNLPDSAGSAKGVFEGCTSLETLTLKTSKPPIIGKDAFKDCAALKNFNDGISEGPALILKGTPVNTVPLTSSTTSAAAAAFDNDLLQGPVIGESAFENTGFAEVKFEGAAPQIGVNAFRNCKNLSKVFFDFVYDIANVPVNPGLTQISAGAFLDCSKLAEVWFDNEPPQFMNGSDLDSYFPHHGDAAGQPDQPAFFVKKMKDDTFGSNWDPMRQAKRMIVYDSTNWADVTVSGLKESYDVWETMNFSAKGAQGISEPGNLRLDPPVSWELWAPSNTPEPWTTGSDTPYYSGAWGTVENPTSGPWTGTVYPARRPYGVWTLRINSKMSLFYNGQWQQFQRYSDGTKDTMFQFEFLPPPIPAEAGYQLTVLGGSGGGYYQVDDSAPLSPKPPKPGAKFVRWELTNGTGTFDDPTSPEARFTMAVGPATVKAVYDLSGTEKPVSPPKPSRNPPTGDRAAALPIAAGALALLAAIAALGRAKALRRATARAKRHL